jgi:hypothetical protein
MQTNSFSVRALRGLAVLASVLAMACTTNQTATMSGQSSVDRGRYLVTIGDCNDCHSPKVFTAQGPVPDTTRLLSGHPADEAIPTVPGDLLGPGKWGAISNNGFTAWAGPWGVSFTANLTPDQSGLEAWTKDMFIQAMRTGKHMGQGRPILPPMPWPNFAQMTDEDLGAVFDYLRSIKPVRNSVPQPIPPVAGSP